MKKLLALVLALVMTMSLVTISNAAFKDADKIDNAEAVEVMNAVGVLVGDEKGNFNPDENLTRAQAAKIISYLLLGNKTAEALAGSNKFVDVAASNWAAGFIGYCASTGVVAGVGDGKFDPNGQLTGYQFAKMLLVALGYDATIEGFTGTDWQINVSKIANQNDLFKGVSKNGNVALNRDEAAQMAFNTLKAPLVQYTNKGTEIKVNGAEVTFGASAFEYVTSTRAQDQTISSERLSNNTAFTVEFAEKYYSTLTVKGTTDAFGRPARTWILDKKEIGTYVDYSDMIAEYTAAVTGKEMYDLLGKSIVDDKDWGIDVLVDGETDDMATQIAKNNKSDLDKTGNGVLTQVFVNNDAKKVTIVIVNTYLAEALTDYSAKKDTVKLSLYVKNTTKDVKGEDYSLVTDAKDGDLYLVTYADNSVQSVALPEIVKDTAISAFSLNASNKIKSIVVGNDTYKANKYVGYDANVLNKYTGTGATNLKDTTYNVYLDKYGYMIGVDIVEAPSNYLFITGIDANSSFLATKNASANVIFLDGTNKVVEIKVKSDDAATTAALNGNAALINKWFTYTVDKNDVYTVTVVADKMDNTNTSSTDVAQKADATTNYDIDKKNISLPGEAKSGTAFTKVYGNDDTIYLSAKLSKVTSNASGNEKNVVISGIDAVTTGVRNASIKSYTASEVYGMAAYKSFIDAASYASGDAVKHVAAGVYTLYKENGYIIAAVVVGEDSAASKNLAYVHTDSVAKETYNPSTGIWTWTRNVIIDGEEVTLTESNDTGVSVLKDSNKLVKGGWSVISFKADETVNDAEKASTTSLTGKNSYVTSIADAVSDTKGINKAGVENVLLDSTSTVKMSLIGNSLYDLTTGTQGFFVDDNVKIVLIQTNDAKETTSYETGVSTLKAMLADLNEDANKAINYTFDAYIENGAAKVVVIDDANKGGYTPNDKGDSRYTVTLSGGVATVTSYGVNPEDDAAVAAVEAELVKQGYNVTKRDFTPGSPDKYTWTATAKNGFTYTFDYSVGSAARVYKVTLKLAAGAEQYATLTSDSVIYVAKDGTSNVEVTFKTLTSGTRTFTVASSDTSVSNTTVGGSSIAADGKASFTLKLTQAKDGTVEINW